MAAFLDALGLKPKADNVQLLLLLSQVQLTAHSPQVSRPPPATPQKLISFCHTSLCVLCTKRVVIKKRFSALQSREAGRKKTALSSYHPVHSHFFTACAHCCWQAKKEGDTLQCLLVFFNICRIELLCMVAAVAG